MISKNQMLRKQTQNKPKQTQLFRSLPPKGSDKFHRPGDKPFSENGAEKGLTTPAGSDSLKDK